VPTIALDRRFLESYEGEHSDPDLLIQFGFGKGLDWPHLLSKRRVVILAEAGSGKTEELQEQARQQLEAQRFAFYARLQDVGREGFPAAFRRRDRTRFSAWLASDQPAWFFIDSVDEAKLDGVRLERALQRIADGILNAEHRAHVIISGRYSDWQFRRDLLRLNEELPIRPDVVLPPPPAPNDLLITTIRRRAQRQEPTPVEVALVVVMAPLDADRVRRFASGKNAPDLDAFMAQIAVHNLWRFARRPLDLEWLVDYWREHIGSANWPKC
jgi:hypothetical protein